MSEHNWERLVRAAFRRERLGADAFGRPHSGIADNVPSCLGNRDIDAILRAADEIQEEDPNVARILCEHAYSLAQNLDPNSEGRGVLQFKTGLMLVFKQRLAKRDGGSIDRSQDIARLQEFYKKYREKNKVDELREDEMKLRELSGNLGELERTTVKRKRVFATLKVLGTVVEELTKEVSPEEAERLIPEEMKRVMESDAAMTEDLIAYNIIPMDSQTITNAIVSLGEIQPACGFFEWVDEEIDQAQKLLEKIDVLENKLKTACERNKCYIRLLMWTWAGIVFFFFMCYLLMASTPVDGLERL